MILAGSVKAMLHAELDKHLWRLTALKAMIPIALFILITSTRVSIGFTAEADNYLY